LRHLVAVPDCDCAALLAASLLPGWRGFLFAHALIRDGIYASLTRSRRAELHRAAAEWYRERDLALAAEHLDRAEAPEAVRAYLAAAQAQSAALHPERALALASRGAALAREPQDLHALNMLCGRLHCEGGDGNPALVTFEHALAAADEPAQRCRALLGIAASHRLTGAVDAALAALAEAEPIARAHGLTRELAELHHTRGNVHFARGDVAGCRAAHEAALAFAHEIRDVAWEALAISGLADASYAVKMRRSSAHRVRRVVRGARPHPSDSNLAMAGHCRIYLTGSMPASRTCRPRMARRWATGTARCSRSSHSVSCSRSARVIATAGRCWRGAPWLRWGEALSGDATVLAETAHSATQHGRTMQQQALGSPGKPGCAGRSFRAQKARMQDDPVHACAIHEAEALRKAASATARSAITAWDRDALARQWGERHAAALGHTRRAAPTRSSDRARVSRPSAKIRATPVREGAHATQAKPCA
jgi:tetratricopeptide (TPR) repeat protein